MTGYALADNLFDLTGFLTYNPLLLVSISEQSQAPAHGRDLNRTALRDVRSGMGAELSDARTTRS